MASNKRYRNYPRRAVGMIFALLPFGLLAASLTVGLRRGHINSIPGLAFMLAAAGLAVLNFHLAFVRPLLFRRRHGSLGTYHFVSGLPVFGTLLTLIGAVVGFGAVLPAALGIVSMLLDTGGAFWFVVCTWRDTSLWDD